MKALKRPFYANFSSGMLGVTISGDEALETFLFCTCKIASLSHLRFFCFVVSSRGAREHILFLLTLRCFSALTDQVNLPVRFYSPKSY